MKKEKNRVMKKIGNKVMMLFIAAGISFTASADHEPVVPYQKQHNDHIQEIFKAWNEDKGEWLYNSMSSIVMMDEYPEREGDASKTTFEYLSEFSDHRKNRILTAAEVALEEEMENAENQDAYFWERWMELVNSTSCETSQGRSNGDPHMTTFDGEKYDFQTAGEYLLSESLFNNFFIQTRQVRHNETISVNGAMAVNVNGDFVTAYAQDFPDDRTDKLIRVNGEVLEHDEDPVYLPEGGIIRKVRGRHVIFSPTGEQVHFKTRTFQGSALLDIDIFIPSCTETESQTGLLGNADGNRDTDLVVREPSEDNEDGRVADVNRDFDNIFGQGRNNQEQRDSEAARLEFLSRDFGDQFIVDEEYSIFEEPMGELPDYERYPTKHLTLSDLTDEEIDEGVNECRNAGVAEEDLMECVFDYGYVGLEPDLPATYDAPEDEREVGLPEKKPEAENNNQNNNNRNARRATSIGIGTMIFRGGNNRGTRANRSGSRTSRPSGSRTTRSSGSRRSSGGTRSSGGGRR